MSQNNQTPLWLNLKKEYIDDNINSLQIYLKANQRNDDKDQFFMVTINLLEERIGNVIETIANRKIFEENINRDEIIFNARLLAIYLLASPNGKQSLNAFIALLGELRLLSKNYSEKLLHTVFERLRHQSIKKYGFTWDSLNDIGTEKFAHNLCSQIEYGPIINHNIIYPNKGTAIINNQGMFIATANNIEVQDIIANGAKSLSTNIALSLITKDSEKLRQKDETNIDKISEFTSNFIASQIECRQKQETKRVYSVNDPATVVITEIIGQKIKVKTVDHNYETLCGELKFDRNSVMYHYVSTFPHNFRIGDCFNAIVTNVQQPKFNIEKDMVDFMINDNKSNIGYDQLFDATLIDERRDYYVWLNTLGVPVYTRNNGEYHQGDFATLHKIRYGEGEQYGKIYAEIDESTEPDKFDINIVRNECLRAFAEHVTMPYQKPQAEQDYMSAHTIALLMKQIFEHQKNIMKSADKYRMLALALVMATLIEDESACSYLQFTSTYLKVLVRFVNNNDITNSCLCPKPEYSTAESTLLRINIVNLLKEYGKSGHSNLLAETIRNYPNQMMARLAQLIQTSNDMRGTLSDAAINVIRHEIIKLLSIETEERVFLEDDTSIYLGIESGTQEFKTSMVYPPNNQMQPDERTQNKNVLKGVCAFLNSTLGGTLYVGVNDLGHVTGIANDMKFLRHSSIDTYLRYIQDTIKAKLGIDTLPSIRIEPLYDNKVVAIHIEPHPYRVVELDGVAYQRMNAESREMTDKMKQDLISRKVLTNSNEAAAIRQLQHACETKKCAILHNYASSNSGNVADREVEPYDIKLDDKLVVCYDRNAINGKKIKVFNITRIGHVEVLQNKPWEHVPSHRKIEIDSFHMTGDTKIKVSLKMDLFARNLLIEEYPKTKNELKQDLNDTNTYYYDAVVYNIEPLGRFYMGLANRITITDCPKLKEYVDAFVKSHLQ